jgi:hypothetical protein
MLKQTIATLLAITFVYAAAPADAQATKTGAFGRTTRRSNNYRFPNAAATMNQQLPGVRQAGLGGLAPVFGGGGRNGLPRTELSGFVRGGNAEAIYGDEGSDGPPPYFEFTAAHRIERGIRSNGLTTGHGSSLPAAWGGDEFCKGSEFSMAGQQGGGSVAATAGAAGGNGTRAMFPTQGGVNFGAAQAAAPQAQMLSGQQFVSQFQSQFPQNNP